MKKFWKHTYIYIYEWLKYVSRLVFFCLVLATKPEQAISGQSSRVFHTLQSRRRRKLSLPFLRQSISPLRISTFVDSKLLLLSSGELRFHRIYGFLRSLLGFWPAKEMHVSTSLFCFNWADIEVGRSLNCCNLSSGVRNYEQQLQRGISRLASIFPGFAYLIHSEFFFCVLGLLYYRNRIERWKLFFCFCVFAGTHHFIVITIFSRW